MTTGSGRDEVAELLGQSALFSALPEQAREQLASYLHRRRYRSGEALFYQGDQGNDLFLIASGRVKIASHSPEGRESLVALLGKGEIIGELSMLDGKPRSAEARAIEDTTVYVLSEPAFKEFVASHPSVTWGLMRVLAERLRRADEAVADAAFLDVPGRVAKRLLDLAEQHGITLDSGIRIGIPLTQEQLAGMVGATREGVNRAVSAFSARGVIERRGRHYVIKDLAKLEARAR